MNGWEGTTNAAFWSRVWSFTAAGTAELAHKQTALQRGVQLKTDMLDVSLCSERMYYHQSRQWMLSFIFLTAWLCGPLISAGYLYHCSGFAHLCVLLQQQEHLS